MNARRLFIQIHHVCVVNFQVEFISQNVACDMLMRIIKKQMEVL